MEIGNRVAEGITAPENNTNCQTSELFQAQPWQCMGHESVVDTPCCELASTAHRP